MNDTLHYFHLYTDDNGDTHFREKKLEFTKRDDIENRDSITVSAIEGARGAVLYKIQAGEVEDWHTAPRKQFNFVIQGTVEVTASDGEKLIISPGSVLLIDDTTGKGHITANIGDEDHIALMIPVT